VPPTCRVRPVVLSYGTYASHACVRIYVGEIFIDSTIEEAQEHLARLKAVRFVGCVGSGVEEQEMRCSLFSVHFIAEG
jgi:hypothetical protein